MDRRTIIALGLCAVVLLVQFLVVMPMIHRYTAPKPEKAPEQATQGAEAAKTPGPEPAAKPSEEKKPEKAPEVAPPAPMPVVSEGPAPEVRSGIVLENEWLHTEWTNESTGACTLIRFKKEFYADTKKDPLDLLGSYPEVIYGMEVPGKEIQKVTRKAMVLDISLVEPEELTGSTFTITEATDKKIVFAGTMFDKNGKLLNVTKTVWLPADKFEIAMDVQFSNATKEKLSFKYSIGAAEAIRIEEIVNVRSGRWGAKGPFGSATVDETSFGKTPKWVDPPEAEQAAGASVLWTGLENKYFALVLMGIPPQANQRGELMLRATGRQIQFQTPGAKEPIYGASVRLVSPSLELEPGQTSDIQKFTEFAGPKRKDVTAKYELYGLDTLHYSGWFAFIANPMMWLLRGLNALVHNWGVAIVLLTVIIRVCLHPLTKKGQVSMYKMQKLQPKIKELQVKYKGDKQKLGMEQMKLMKDSGASPLSGCLPMLIQMPILFGLYYGLADTFELRHAPFVLWMKDLSQPDALWIGFISVNMLPILMTVAMFLQQRMTPKSPDPQTQQQMKIMQWMPIIFAFMFYSMPSGLCLYWFVSTLLGMVDQYIINRHLRMHEGLGNESAA